MRQFAIDRESSKAHVFDPPFNVDAFAAWL